MMLPHPARLYEAFTFHRQHLSSAGSFLTGRSRLPLMSKDLSPDSSAPAFSLPLGQRSWLCQTWCQPGLLEEQRCFHLWKHFSVSDYELWTLLPVPSAACTEGWAAHAAEGRNGGSGDLSVRFQRPALEWDESCPPDSASCPSGNVNPTISKRVLRILNF